MLRNVGQKKAKKPVMVMLHGSGSSGTILGIQTYSLAKDLSKTYDLVFLDGPAHSTPGPGVLPLFADMPDYYRWLTPGSVFLPHIQRLAELANVSTYIQEQLEAQNVHSHDVVAMLGFSQGALVAMVMLGLRLAGRSPWPNLRFCVAIGAGTTGNTAQMDAIQDMVASFSSALGRQDAKFPGYSVQASGLTDPWYKDGKRLASLCAKDKTKVLDYRDGHVVPRKRPAVLQLLQAIRAISEASAVGFHDMELVDTPLTEHINNFFPLHQSVAASEIVAG